jgi:hypothetical protein
MDYKVTSFDLKLALLRYFRFERQWVCVDEFRGADVIADTGKDIIEVEVKISKYDLMYGEEKKPMKHLLYRMGKSFGRLHPNKFYFCVPETLVTTAINVSEALNSRYGIVAFNSDVFKRHIQWGWKAAHAQCLRMARQAKRLHESYIPHQKAIAMRTSSKIVTLMEADFRTRLQNSKGD